MLRLELTMAIPGVLLWALLVGTIHADDGLFDRARERADSFEGLPAMEALPLPERDALAADMEKALKRMPLEHGRTRMLMGVLENMPAPKTVPPSVAEMMPSGSSGGETVERLAILVSSSMPEASLRRLAEQARRVDAVLVFRGLVDDDFTAMARYLEALLGAREGRGPIVRAIIEPRLFQRFGVERVPAFVVASNGVCLRRCPPGSDGRVRLVAGDVSLAYALRAMRNAHPELEPLLDGYLARLEASS